MSDEQTIMFWSIKTLHTSTNALNQTSVNFWLYYIIACQKKKKLDEIDHADFPGLVFSSFNALSDTVHS